MFSGFETSKYAVSKTIKPVKKLIKKFTSFSDLSLIHSKFDCIIAKGGAKLIDDKAIQLLKNKLRLSKGKSFITLASYETEKDYWLFKDWTVLGSLLTKQANKEFKKYIYSTT